MDIFYRSKPPIYRGSCPTPRQARTGMLSSIWGALFGGDTPRYHCKDDENGAAVSAVSGEALVAPDAPAYKTAPTDAPDCDSGNPESACECPEGVVNEVYIE